MWLTNQANGSIGRIAPDGAVTRFSSGSTLGPSAITVGPDGNLWFIAVGVVTTSTDPSLQHPFDLVGPDGARWFSLGPYDRGAPKVPTGLTLANGPNPGELVVHWSAPADDGSPTTACRVTLFRSFTYEPMPPLTFDASASTRTIAVTPGLEHSVSVPR